MGGNQLKTGKCIFKNLVMNLNANPPPPLTLYIKFLSLDYREGRAALVTSFGMFKYIALYSMIQFTTVMIIYSVSQEVDHILQKTNLLSPNVLGFK